MLHSQFGINNDFIPSAYIVAIQLFPGIFHFLWSQDIFITVEQSHLGHWDLGERLELLFQILNGYVHIDTSLLEQVFALDGDFDVALWLQINVDQPGQLPVNWKKFRVPVKGEERKKVVVKFMNSSFKKIIVQALGIKLNYVIQKLAGTWINHKKVV